MPPMKATRIKAMPMEKLITCYGQRGVSASVSMAPSMEYSFLRTWLRAISHFITASI
jgi:hypothetical protein